MKNKITCKKITIIFSILALLAIIICTMCDIAINRKLTWSIISNGSIAFGYLLTVPIINNGKKGTLISLIFLTILTIPYLFLLNGVLNVSNLFLSIGISSYIIMTLYLWIIYILFIKLKNRPLLWSSISWILLIILCLLINIVLHKQIDEPIIDSWDIISWSILLLISISSFIFDLLLKKKGK